MQPSEPALGKHTSAHRKLLVAVMLVKAKNWKQTIRWNHMKVPFYGTKTVKCQQLMQLREVLQDILLCKTKSLRTINTFFNFTKQNSIF